ncbi:bifunctional 3,4-dihydroxy-2-butanone-4-phosphate synthase/GTP cyclohydrolase II [Fimbriimonas ginsengisoli]|uniref:Riboflavin biosynthesis protein RibBA n=1 Tax=Fimbriimonas ginsengisoli Gsoil 348 TaxID=661478 RepID=A0A068NVQ1_FIMGI|nr:bifunctional 3,4-dihydroxy-2-butanone-4-phosphate synthase/GTP cyclohydrolase II [Fimbriimonas ginsengisoli]AIE85669.1 3,4-dihydroxy-2-butanone 4-phosphate synthase [Fimbriimonas ginsengisoli Gsoil 348]
MNEFASIPEALEELKAGRLIVVVDDPDRENEGDLVCAGETCTPELMNFMILHGRGVPFIPTTAERLAELQIPMMTKQNTARHGTAMAETVDALHGATTGVSAFDRARTVEVFVDENASPDDLARPGHIIPLRAEKGGVLKRAGHTEAIVDLCVLAGFKPVGVGCEILNEDGTMMRLDNLVPFAEKHGLKIVTIADLIAYRRKHERLVTRVAGPIDFPTKFGHFTLYAYETSVEPNPYVAIVKGDVCTEEPVLVRIHSSCLTGDLMGSLRCDCGDQLELALRKIEEAGQGVVLYIAQEGRGIGLINKLRAYELQDQGLDTVEANVALGFKADLRDYGLGAQVLADLGLRKLRLMTNNPKKVSGLQGYGLEIVEHVPLLAEPAEEREKYLATKKSKMGHMLP